jgi:hypothetical protein
MERQNKKSNCRTWARESCAESTYDDTFSNYVQYAAEVPILLNFLRHQKLTNDANEADIFVVPYLAATEMRVSDRWGDPGRTNKQALLKSLTHFESYPSKHVFLATSDRSHYIWITKLQDDKKVVALSLGPKCRPTDIVVPPPMVGGGQKVDFNPKAKREMFLFVMFGLVNSERHRIMTQLKKAQQDRRDLKISVNEIKKHRIWPIGPVEAYEKMRQSTFCPIVIGDLPYQKRFFDVIDTGCIPVVIDYGNKNVKGVFYR